MEYRFIPSCLSVPVLTVLVFEFLVLVNSEKVPLMIWSSNQKNQLMSFKAPRNTFDDIFPEDLLAEFPIKSKKVAFVQDNINVEQFSHAKLPFLSELIEQNGALFYPYSTYVPEYYSNFELIIPLKDGATLEENEELIKTYVDKFNEANNDTDSTIFVLTGKQNSIFKDDENRKQRLRRAVKDEKKITILQYPKDADPCIYAHFSAINITFYKSFEDLEIEKQFKFTDFEITNAMCTNDTKGKISSTDSADFQLKSGDTKIDMSIEFEFHQSKMWGISAVKINYESNEWSTVNLTDMYIEDQFSYSCSQKSYKLRRPNIASFAEINFFRFQIQPFVLKHSSFIFEDSYDCSVWFTIPILSSLIVCLLLVLILYFGIRALMSISTPDRFENPKSKGLIITNVEE